MWYHQTEMISHERKHGGSDWRVVHQVKAIHGATREPTRHLKTRTESGMRTNNRGSITGQSLDGLLLCCEHTIWLAKAIRLSTEDLVPKLAPARSYSSLVSRHTYLGIYMYIYIYIYHLYIYIYLHLHLYNSIFFVSIRIYIYICI